MFLTFGNRLASSVVPIYCGIKPIGSASWRRDRPLPSRACRRFEATICLRYSVSGVSALDAAESKAAALVPSAEAIFSMVVSDGVALPVSMRDKCECDSPVFSDTTRIGILRSLRSRLIALLNFLVLSGIFEDTE